MILDSVATDCRVAGDAGEIGQLGILAGRSLRALEPDSTNRNLFNSIRR